jgi:cysteine synthase A
VSRYLKNTQGKAITTVAVEPTDSPIITQVRSGEAPKPAPHKIQGIGAGFVPKNLDMSLVDQVETVTNEDAIAMAHRLMREVRYSLWHFLWRGSGCRDPGWPAT